VHHPDHFLSLDPERGAVGNGSGRGHPQSAHRSQGLLPDKVSSTQQRDRSFFAVR